MMMIMIIIKTPPFHLLDHLLHLLQEVEAKRIKEKEIKSTKKKRETKGVEVVTHLAHLNLTKIKEEKKENIPINLDHLLPPHPPALCHLPLLRLALY